MSAFSSRIHTLRNLSKAAVVALLIAVGAQISLPLGPVPFTFQTVFVPLCAFFLVSPYGILSILLYLLMGFIGLPVFAGLSGGAGHIVGPTGGFLMGFFCSTLLIQIQRNFWLKSNLRLIAGLFLHTCITFFCGGLWMAYTLQKSQGDIFLVALMPFYLFALIKMFLAYTLILYLRAMEEKR